MNPVRVGAAIKSLRIQAGYTQRDLAECLHVTDKAVSKWERGLSIPDISIITKLSLLLNCDVDNLLEGNITYLERTWQGLLILKEYPDVYAGSEVYGKPLVYLYLSYFMLAGIAEISIYCTRRDRIFIESQLGDGSAYGLHLRFLSDDVQVLQEPANTMVVFQNPFVYGPNLTKYFQRAMSRQNGISVLTLLKKPEKTDIPVSFDKHSALQIKASAGEMKHCCVPIAFFPEKYADQIGNIGNLKKLCPLFAEPMGNGMIEYSVTDQDALLDTAAFMRYLKRRTGRSVYDLKEIAEKRNLIESKHPLR